MAIAPLDSHINIARSDLSYTSDRLVHRRSKVHDLRVHLRVLSAIGMQCTIRALNFTRDKCVELRLRGETEDVDFEPLTMRTLHVDSPKIPST